MNLPTIRVNKRLFVLAAVSTLANASVEALTIHGSLALGQAEMAGSHVFALGLLDGNLGTLTAALAPELGTYTMLASCVAFTWMAIRHRK